MKPTPPSKKTAQLKKAPSKKPQKNSRLQTTQKAGKDECLLLRTLLDLSPDAVLVIDPHDPVVAWPVVDCNLARSI